MGLEAASRVPGCSKVTTWSAAASTENTQGPWVQQARVTQLHLHAVALVAYLLLLASSMTHSEGRTEQTLPSPGCSMHRKRRRDQLLGRASGATS